MAWPSNSSSFLLPPSLHPPLLKSCLQSIRERLPSLSLSLPTTEEVFCEITPPPLLAAKTDSERAADMYVWLVAQSDTALAYVPPSFLSLPSSSDPFSERESERCNGGRYSILESQCSFVDVAAASAPSSFSTGSKSLSLSQRPKRGRCCVCEHVSCVQTESSSSRLCAKAKST